MDAKILVTGATGQQGGAVIRHLIKAGQKVRAFTRHPEKAEKLKKMGVEIVAGDLTDRESVAKALEGIKNMFLVTTPYESGMDAEVSQGINAVEAAKETGIEHLVYSSVGSAHRNTGIPHFETKWRVEQHIRKLNLKATILRPVFFMDNFGAPWMLPSLHQGALSVPMGSNRKLAMVAVDNIGAYAAAAFLNPGKFIGQEIELAGEELTFPEALDQISRISGKKIEYHELQLPQAEKVFGHEFTIMFAWFEKVGYNPNIEALKKDFRIPLKTFAEYLKDAPWVNKLQEVRAIK
ncbi:MAG TPA: hypothetical protein DEO84_08490 [candidate division Zixibacteria bacterium]|jgi:uncharacterized protein YbjT (DUF2867 family)|nr:hypothetical protein [candidate division Zixibacteria bacterium]